MMVSSCCLDFGAQALDLLEPPFKPWAQAGFGLALGRLIGEQLIGAEVEHACEVGEQVGRRMVALGLAVGDAAAGDAELVGELMLGEACRRTPVGR